jgi:hypothetical protein
MDGPRGVFHSRWTVKKQDVRLWTRLNWLRIGTHWRAFVSKATNLRFPSRAANFSTIWMT